MPLHSVINYKDEVCNPKGSAAKIDLFSEETCSDLDYRWKLSLVMSTLPHYVRPPVQRPTLTLTMGPTSDWHVSRAKD